MPKINVNGRNNWLSLSGNVDFNSSRLNQYLLNTSDVTFNSVNVTSNVQIGNDLSVIGDTIINGDLTVTGNATIVNTNITTFKDNILLLNASELGSGVTSNLSGIEVDRGSLVNYQSVFQESTQFFKIGQIGSLQCVATREDAPLSYGAMIFNPVLQRIDSSNTFPLKMTFNKNDDSTSSSTGSLIVNGGIGLTGNLCSDGFIAIKGTNYNNSIQSNGTNDFIINAANNIFLLTTGTGKSVNISNNVTLRIGGGFIVGSSSNLVIENTLNRINLNTGVGVYLQTSRYIGWNDSNTNSIRFDGTNMSINASNSTVINSIVSITNSTASSLSSNGALIVSGGVGIDKNTNSASSSVGGALSVLGGAGIQGDVYMGRRLIVGDQSIALTQITGQGINLRSLNRTFSTNTNGDIAFNSFEGGSINSVSSVISNASTVYIEGAPTMSGGGVLNNTYALYIASGAVNFGGGFSVSGTTPSTSYTTGAFAINGGIGINLAQNAVSITNGGSFSSAGGMAVGMDGYFGGKLDIANTNFSVSQASLGGVNFRSRLRTVTTSVTSDMAFNSFDGGVINTSANINNATSVYITGSPTFIGSGSIGTSYAFWVGSGLSRFDGRIRITDSTPSTNNSTGSVTLSGGLSISLGTDSTSANVGGSITTAGGVAVAKTIYAGTGYFSVNGIGNHYTLQNNGSNRFSFNLINSESGSNTGTDLAINRYDDSGTIIDNIFTIKRSSGAVTITGSIASTSKIVGQIVTNGGIAINTTSDALSYTNGGSLTSGGGFAFAGSGYINGNLNINSVLNANTGISNFGQTNINTNNGTLNITGMNPVTINTGSIGITSNTSNINIVSATGTSITSSSGGTTLSATGNSSFQVSSGTLNLSGSSGMTINSGTGTLDLQTTNANVNLNSGTGAINFVTTNTGTGLRLATTGTGVPVTIGDSLSVTTLSGNLTVGGNLTVNGTTTAINSTLVTINDIAFVVNNMPTGISDGGFLIRRYQTPNNSGTGQVVDDTPKVSSSFQSGNALPDTLVLNASSSSINDYYKGWWVKITSGTGINQVRRILSYNGTNKTVVLYSTTNNNANGDGLNLATAPSLGDTYNLYDVPYAGIYYSAPNRELRFAGVPFDQQAGVFANPTSYLRLHCQSMVLEDNLIINSNLQILFTNAQALVVGQTGGTTATDYNFIVNTITGYASIANVVNTINSTTGFLFNQKDSTGSVETYSSIYSQIVGNTASSAIGNLYFTTKVSGTLTNLMLLNGNLSTVDFTSSCNSVRVLNTTATTSSSTGCLLLSGGIGISNTTDATSLTSGGTLTTAGGASISKSLFVGDKTYLQGTNKVGSGNTLTGTQGNVNLNGDLVLYNATSQSIYFAANGSSSPSYTTRSVGTKVVYRPNISGSTCDYATGISTNSLWNSVPSTTESFDWFLGTSNYMTLNSSGVKFNLVDTGIRFSNNTNIYLNNSTSNLHFVPASNLFSFRNTADTTDVLRINERGLITLAVSNINVSPSISGSIFNVANTVFTDNVTSASGTTGNFVISSFNQSTLSATNTLVTTTNAISTYFGGAVIRGTNETITNDYNVYIAQGSSLGVATNAYSFYIQGEPTGTITNSYSLYVDGSGISYINGRLILASNSGISNNSNTITNSTGSLNVNGDIVLYNSTKQSVIFNSTGSGVPSFTTRSSGTKVVLLPNISASTIDYALGVSSSSLWYSVSDTTCNHSWYLGTSRRLQLDNTGIIFTSGGGNVVQKMNNNTTGMSLCGGSATGNSNGAQIDIYGASSGTGDLVLNSGASGKIACYTGGNLAMTINNSQNIVLASVTDSTGASDGSFHTPGGMNVNKSMYVGTNFVLNFNQPYIYNGDSSGRLNVTSNVTGFSSRIRNFTFDGNNSTDNVHEIYGIGGTGSLVNTEFMSIGFLTSTTRYTISSNTTGSGTVRPLTLQTGSNTGQILLNIDGSVNMNTGTLNTQKILVNDTTDASSGVGSLVTLGGAYITKKLIVNSDTTVNGNFSAGVNSASITIYTPVVNLANVAAVTPRNAKTIVNNNEILFSCAFTMQPTAANTLTSFIIDLPLAGTNFTQLYDAIITTSGFCNDGSSNQIDIENIRAYPIIGTTRCQVIFTSGTNVSVANGHVIQMIARYTKN